MKNNFENKKFNKILPSDVRYALEYKEGILNKDDLEVLAMSNFEIEAMYLTLKGIKNNPEQHKILLEKYVSSIFSTKDNTGINKKDIRDITVKEIEHNPSIEVDAVKLAQISRQGFDFWQEKFKDLADKLSNEKRNVFLLAHATILGLEHFVKSFSEKNKTLNIIVPSWVKDKSDIIGYSIKFDSQKSNVQLLHDTFDKENAVLVDDTLNTGNTTDEIKKYFKESGSQEPELITIATS